MALAVPEGLDGERDEQGNPEVAEQARAESNLGRVMLGGHHHTKHSRQARNDPQQLERAGRLRVWRLGPKDRRGFLPLATLAPISAQRVGRKIERTGWSGLDPLCLVEWADSTFRHHGFSRRY